MSKIQPFEDVLLDWTRFFMQRSMHDFTHWMAHNGLSRSQMGALMHLHHHANCPVTHIGNELDISTPAASQLVDRLVEMGLVNRIDDPNDARIRYVVLNAAGKSVLDEGFQARQGWMLELGSSLSEEQQNEIAEALHTLMHAAMQTDNSEGHVHHHEIHH